METYNILFTGCCGFIGSNVVNFFCEKYPNYKIYNIDRLDYCSNVNRRSAACHISTKGWNNIHKKKPGNLPGLIYCYKCYLLAATSHFCTRNITLFIDEI